MRYAVIIEKSSEGYGAYAPDLPGVGVVGDSVEEIRQLIREAIDLHVQGLKEDGQPIPEASVEIDYVETAA